MRELNDAYDEIVALSGNKGEWSEIYIFLKLLINGKVYAADKNLNKVPNAYLNILDILREEVKGNVYDYKPGKNIAIYKNNVHVGPDLPVSEYAKMMENIWGYLSSFDKGTIQIPSANSFLSKIHVTKLKSPAFSNNGFFGGTEDITMKVSDYRSGMETALGFSCKSDLSAASTLFNASKDNTNFAYEITGPIDDSTMEHFNSIFDDKGHVAIKNRIKYLKSIGCDVHFIDPVIESAKRNLILSGGMEMPLIIGGLLKFYYWDNEASTAHSSVIDALKFVTATDVAKYGLSNLDDIYARKIGTLLFDMFTGMRLAKDWDGRASVNGGYIIVKNNGEVLAYHTIIADQFKDFLLNSLAFESPSASRHDYMKIYKEGGKFKIKFNMQIRFKRLG